MASMKTKLRTLLDATFDTGLYTGRGRTHTATFETCKAKRDTLWHELEADIDDLLEACKAIVQAEKKAMRGSLVEFYAAVDIARKAIAKAEGE